MLRAFLLLILGDTCVECVIVKAATLDTLVTLRVACGHGGHCRGRWCQLNHDWDQWWGRWWLVLLLWWWCHLMMPARMLVFPSLESDLLLMMKTVLLLLQLNLLLNFLLLLPPHLHPFLLLRPLFRLGRPVDCIAAAVTGSGLSAAQLFK